MKIRHFFAVAILCCSLFASETTAQDVTPSDGTDVAVSGDFAPMALGTTLLLGLANGVGDLYEDSHPRFAAGINLYFDYYFTKHFALEAGLGLVGKGLLYDFTYSFGIEGSENETTTEYKAKLLYLEIPVRVKFNLHGLHLGAGIALIWGLTGKLTIKTDDSEEEQDFDWDERNIRRFNLGPSVYCGYAFAMGSLSLVPGIVWTMHLINDNEEGDDSLRAMNVMFNLGAEFGFGS